MRFRAGNWGANSWPLGAWGMGKRSYAARLKGPNWRSKKRKRSTRAPEATGICAARVPHQSPAIKLTWTSAKEGRIQSRSTGVRRRESLLDR